MAIVHAAVIAVDDDDVRTVFNPAPIVDAVVGPDSATDGHIAVFSGSTGKIIADGGAPGGGSLLTATVTLTDAQIKALPITPVVIVPSPGVDKWISIIQIILTSHFEGGAYSGWSDGDLIGTETSSVIYDFASEGVSNLTKFLGNTFDDSNLLVLRPWIAGFSEDFGVIEAPGLSSAYVNAPLTLFTESSEAVPWSGGHASNSLRVKTIYTIEDA